MRCITIACSIVFNEIFIDGMGATNTWHHNFQIVTSSFVFGNFTLSGLIIWKACISEYLFQSFFLSVILFFYWADIDEEKSTTANISVNGTYPLLFVPRPQILALHCLLYLVYHHWFHSKFVHYFFDNKIFCNTTLPFYILLRRLFFLFVLIKTSSAASSGRFYFFSPTCISWPNIASCNEHVIPPR